VTLVHCFGQLRFDMRRSIIIDRYVHVLDCMDIYLLGPAFALHQDRVAAVILDRGLRLVGGKI
jgi:hypothetical protein